MKKCSNRKLFNSNIWKNLSVSILIFISTVHFVLTNMIHIYVQVQLPSAMLTLVLVLAQST